MQDAQPHQGFLEEQAKRTARQQALKELHGDLFPQLTGGLLEIGCGHGHWLTAYAEAHPEEFCVGLDLINQRIQKSQKKADKLSLNNIRFIKAEAQEWVEILPDDATLAKVMVLFPDPWPKKRHHRRRLIQPDFLALLATKMAPGGKCYFRTDYDPYFEWTREHFAAHPDWKLDQETDWPMEQSTYFQELMIRYRTLSATVIKNNFSIR